MDFEKILELNKPLSENNLFYAQIHIFKQQLQMKKKKQFYKGESKAL